MKEMSNRNIPVNRFLVGILALGCFGAAGGIWIAYPSDETWILWVGGFTRVGLLMSAFWLALPSSHRQAAWANISKGTLIGIVVALIVTARLKLRIVAPIILADAREPLDPALQSDERTLRRNRPHACAGRAMLLLVRTVSRHLRVANVASG